MKRLILLIGLMPNIVFASDIFGISKSDLTITVMCVTFAILMRSTKEKK